jgi:CheY-like chemotaxis protein
MASNTLTIHILLVEDNSADVILTRMTLEAVKKGQELCSYQLTVLKDGAQALAYFEDESHPRPDVVILDLNLPKVPGLEVLERIRNHPAYEDLHVIILSSSNDDKERQRAHRLGVRQYFHKPSSLPGYQDLATQGRAIGRQILARKR